MNAISLCTQDLELYKIQFMKDKIVCKISNRFFFLGSLHILFILSFLFITQVCSVLMIPIYNVFNSCKCVLSITFGGKYCFKVFRES